MIKEKLEQVLWVIGEDIEDRKISEIEKCYDLINEAKEELRLMIVQYRGRIRNPLILCDKLIIDYFETYLPHYKKKTRERDVIAARFVFVFLMYKCARKTLSSIGRHPAFGKVYDHTTIIHGYQQLIDMYNTDDLLIMEIINHAEQELKIPIKKIIERESELLIDKRERRLVTV